LLGVFGLLLAVYVITFIQVWRTGLADEARPVDAIVVLGAAQYDGRPSPVLEARLSHALELWKKGDAPIVVVTGGKQVGDRFTEATASANYLVERGVPDAAIVREVQGRDTWESLGATARILKARGLRRVLLVSDPYHELRVKEMSEELGLTAFVSATRSSPIKGFAATKRMAREAAGISVGRIIGYRRMVELLG